jgi:hypothetical protein
MLAVQEGEDVADHLIEVGHDDGVARTLVDFELTSAD